MTGDKTVKGQMDEFLKDAHERGNVYLVMSEAYKKVRSLREELSLVSLRGVV